MRRKTTKAKATKKAATATRTSRRRKAAAPAKREKAPVNPAMLPGGNDICRELPSCSRPGCGQPACAHSAVEPHSLQAFGCASYVYPEHWGVCQREGCGAAAGEHDVKEPHGCEKTGCVGFKFTPEVEALGGALRRFENGGGFFGAEVVAVQPW